MFAMNMLSVHCVRAQMTAGSMVMERIVLKWRSNIQLTCVRNMMAGWREYRTVQQQLQQQQLLDKYVFGSQRLRRGATPAHDGIPAG